MIYSKYKPSMYNIQIKEEKERTMIYNSKSGAVAWFEKKYENMLLSGELLENMESRELDQLYSKGFLVDSCADEFSQLVYDIRQATYSKKFETVTYVIAPSMGCNYKCEYCFEKDKTTTVLSKEDWDDVICFIEKQVVANTHLKSLYISWFGGEPLLCINDIVEYSKLLKNIAESRGIEYNARIVTNGSLLSEENAVALMHCGVTRAQISLDGLADTYAKKKRIQKASFDEVIRNISNASKYFEMLVRINIDKENYAEIEPLTEYLMIDCNLKNRVQVFYSLIEPWNEDIADDMYINETDFLSLMKRIHVLALEHGYENSIGQKRPVRRRLPCGLMQTNSLFISSSGKLFKCSHCLGHDEKAIGDIKNGLYHNANELEFLEYEIKSKCKECKAFPICLGGCPANSLIYHRDEIICEKYIDLIKENISFAVACKQKA